MKKSFRIIVASFVFISVLLIAPVKATTTEPIPATWFSTKALDAMYLDLDNDGAADDIMTTFEIRIFDTGIDFSLTKIHCFLFLPSGDGYMISFLVIGQYQYLYMNLSWYNTVTESGWYTFAVYVEITANQSYYSTDSIMFDPPTEGNPGPPLVEVTEINATQI